MATIKVLHYGLSYNKGGVENVVHSWFNHLPNDIHFDFINDSNKPIAYQEEYQQNGSKVYQIIDRYSNPVKHFQEIKKIIVEGEYDYFHFHVENITEADPAIASNQSNKCTCIYHTHSLHGKDPIKEKILVYSAKAFLFGRRYLKLACGYAVGEGVYHSNDFTVIENGINLEKYKYSPLNRNSIRKELNIGVSDYVVGHVGRFGPEKNYPFLVKTFALLKNKLNNCKLMLIGNMNEYDQMKQLLMDYKIEDDTILVGVVNDTSKYYSAMDLFYLPSFEEGVSVSMIEAQACGLPVIGSNVIPKEVKISENVEFIGFDEQCAANTLYDYLTKQIDRTNVNIDNKYDINVSANKMFDYYRNNLRKK